MRLAPCCGGQVCGVWCVWRAAIAQRQQAVGALGGLYGRCGLCGLGLVGASASKAEGERSSCPGVGGQELMWSWARVWVWAEGRAQPYWGEAEWVGALRGGACVARGGLVAGVR